MVSSFSNKINGVEKSKSQTNYNYCNLAELKRHTVGGQVFEQEIHYDKTRPSIIYDLKGTVPDVDVLMTTYYDYDDMGRVTEIYNDGHISYEYDSYGQIIRENNSALDKTFAYEYNDIGNIVNVKEYEYTTEDYDLTYTEKTYTYDASLPDRLTSFNGSTITYNAIGCPTSFDGYSASWTRGKLASLSKSGSQISYDYNAFGQRIGKTYSGSTDYRCEFCYDESGRLVCETKYSDSGSVIDKIIYLYDVNSIIGMVHTLNGVESTYYFQRNLFGDVIGIYNTNGVKVGSYAYDAWGNCTITLDTNGIATRNPIRYRGYYYDTESGLYYLNARYYNPEWRRFISPDSTEYLDPESVNGLNLYAYTNNNPISFSYNNATAVGSNRVGGGIVSSIGAGSSLAGNVNYSSTSKWGLNLRWLANGLDTGSTIHGLYTSISGLINHIFYFAKNSTLFADDMTMLGASMKDGVLAFNQFSWGLGKADVFGIALGFGLDIYDSIQRGVSPGGVVLGAILTVAKGAVLIYLNKGIMYGATAIGSCLGPVGAVVGFVVGGVVCIVVDIFVSNWRDDLIDKIAK